VSLARIDSAALDSAAIDAEVARAISAGEELYGIDEALLAELAADLIVTQSLCTVCAVSGGTVRALSTGRAPAPTVLELEPDGIEGIIESVRIVARAAGVPEAGDRVATELRDRLADVAAPVADVRHRPRVVVLEWLDPPFAAGHWVPEMVELAGGREMLGKPREPSFRTTWDDVRAAQPEVIVLAPCGFDAEETAGRTDHVSEELLDTAANRERRLFAVDANAYFSRPGPRVVEAVALLARILHPERTAGDVPEGSALQLSYGRGEPTFLPLARGAQSPQ
jgi:iron complex transport system substrate-binding protein